MNSFWRMVECPRRAVWVVVLLAALVRVANVAFLVDSPLFLAPTSDEAEHFDLARRIAERGDWLGREEGLMMRPPLFAWVVAGLFGVFGSDFMVVHGLVLLCDVVSVGLWYLVAARCFDRRSAFVAGLGMALYWGFIHFSSTGYMESFALALNGGLVLALCVFFHRMAGAAPELLITNYELRMEGSLRDDDGVRSAQSESGAGSPQSREQDDLSGQAGEGAVAGMLRGPAEYNSALPESGAGSPQSREQDDLSEWSGAGGALEGQAGEAPAVLGVGRGWWLLVVGGLLAGLGVLTRPTLLIVMPWLGLLVAWAAAGADKGEGITDNGERIAENGERITENGEGITENGEGRRENGGADRVGWRAEDGVGRREKGALRAGARAVPGHRTPEGWSWVRGLMAGVVLALFTVVGMAPNAVRHWVLFGEWVPLGINGEINFHMANNDDGWGWWVNSPGLEYDIYRDTPTAIGGRPLTVEGAREYWREENGEFLREKPGEFLRGLGLKWLQVWNGYEIHVINDFREHWRLSRVERWMLPSWVVIGFGFAGMVMALGAAARQLLRKLLITNYRLRIEGSLRDEDLPVLQEERARGLGRLLLVGWVVFYMVGVALYHVNSRHRLPAMPGLVLLGAWAAVRLIGGERITDNGERVSGRSRWAVAGLVVVGFGLAWLPVVPDWMGRHEEWWTHINKGTALAKLDRWVEAVAEFERATVVRPDKLEGWRQLALARESVGDFVGAARAQGVLLRLLGAQYPEYGATRAEQLEVAVRMRLAAGDVAGAARDARVLLGLAPDHWRAYETAARVARAEGNTSAAVALEGRAKDLR